MKENNKISANKKNIAFAIFYVASIILTILFFTRFYHKEPPTKIAGTIENKPEPQKQLLIETDLLLDKLLQLQKADEHYASLFVQSRVTPAMDSVDTQISIEESDFKNIIDSFTQNQNTSGNNEVLFKKINEYFKQTLENRRAIGNIRYALAAGNFDLDSNQKKWLKMNSDLIAKSKQIEALQDLIQSKSDNSSSQIEKSKAEASTLQVSLNRQQAENDNLKQNIKSLNTTIATLQSSLSTKESSPPKNEQASSADREKIRQLTDEIELAKISCNLTRADAQQIISNSKERKELLTVALKSLMALSKSDNAEIREQANGKLKELQRIAGTIRN